VLDELLSIDPQSLDDDELRAHVAALGQLAERVEAARLGALGEWDARALWAYDGAANGAGWLAAQGNVARGTASSCLRSARRLRTMPVTREAVREGRLAPAKAKLLAGVINPRTEAAFARDEDVLVAEARHLTVDETAMLLRRWRLLADEDGPRPADDHDADNAHCSQPTPWSRWPAGPAAPSADPAPDPSSGSSPPATPSAGQHPRVSAPHPTVSARHPTDPILGLIQPPANNRNPICTERP